MPELLTLPAVARLAHLTPGGVRVNVRAGLLRPCSKAGRYQLFDRSEVSRWIQERGGPGARSMRVVPPQPPGERVSI